MAELEKGKPVSLEELMVSTLAMTDAVAKLLIEKGVITDAEFKQKLLEERAVYQRVLNHKAIIISVKLWNYATNTSTLEYKKTCLDACDDVQGGSVVIRLLMGLFVLSICTFSAVAESIDGAENSPKTETILERDWAGLEHYRLANSKTAPPVKGENRVVFLGDSITEFWNLSDYFADMPYINRGVGGQTTSQMLIRFRPDVIALQPRTVVILGGTNDIHRNHNGAILNVVRDNLSSMVELAQVHGISVVIASLLPISNHSKGNDGKPILQTIKRRPEDIKILNEWIKKYANENRLTYLDYDNAMVDKQDLLRPELSFDGLHPNKDGYKIMARLAKQAITSSFRSKSSRYVRTASRGKKPRSIVNLLR